jgi:hypothetical protein
MVTAWPMVSSTPARIAYLVCQLVGVLLGAGGGLGLVELTWWHGELPSTAGGGGALVAYRARRGGRGVELDDDRSGSTLGARAPR